MERLVTEARRNNQPAYIIVPSGYALSPVTPAKVEPLVLKSNEASLKSAVEAVTERLRTANGSLRCWSLQSRAWVTGAGPEDD